MNKLGIFMNFWEKNWDADHEKYIKKVAAIGYDVSSTDEKVRLGGVDYLKRIVEQIGKMDGKLLSGVSYAGWGTPPYILNDKSVLWNNSLKSMAEIIKTAEDNGVTYCVEAVNRFETCLINTAAEALVYVAEVDSPNIGVLLDTYHMNIEETNIGDAIRLVGDKLTSLHTGENNRTAPGKGHLDWDEIFGALAEIGYKGRIVSEPFVMMGGEVGRDIHVFRDLIDNPSEARIDEEAKYLLNFEKEMLKKYNM